MLKYYQSGASKGKEETIGGITSEAGKKGETTASRAGNDAAKGANGRLYLVGAVFNHAFFY